MDVNSEPPAITVLLDYLECSRAFLLEYPNPESLLFFLVAVEGNDSFPSFICPYLTYVLRASGNMNHIQEWPL
jgi:hypothetical protein